MRHHSLFISLFFSIALISCSENTSKRKELTLRDSLRMQGKIIELFPDGKLAVIKSIKDSIYNGPAVFFDENGDIFSIRYMKNGKIENAGINFEDSGRISEICNWQKSRMHNHMHFAWKTIESMDDRPVTIISHSSPFLTVDLIKDTISLGDTMRAKIILNFPEKGFDCNIFVKDPTDQKFVLLAKGTEAELLELPTKTGECEVDIAALLIKKGEEGKSKPTNYDITCKLKCFVKSK